MVFVIETEFSVRYDLRPKEIAYDLNISTCARQVLETRYLALYDILVSTGSISSRLREKYISPFMTEVQ
jgi:hypothetical protein